MSELQELGFREVTTPAGITVRTKLKMAIDWVGARSLFECGVPVAEIARHYKVSAKQVNRRAEKDNWLSPVKVEKLRREIEQRQAKSFKAIGQVADVSEVKAQIWKERVEQRNEKVHQIVMAALEGVTDEKAKSLVRSPLSVLHLVQASRLVTGEEQEEQKAGGMAINVNLLRSSPIDAPILDAEIVD